MCVHFYIYYAYTLHHHRLGRGSIAEQGSCAHVHLPLMHAAHSITRPQTDGRRGRRWWVPWANMQEIIGCMRTMTLLITDNHILSLKKCQCWRQQNLGSLTKTQCSWETNHLKVACWLNELLGHDSNVLFRQHWYASVLGGVLYLTHNATLICTCTLPLRTTVNKHTLKEKHNAS